ncbi:calcium-dependent protein kinase isoform 2 [Nicotiana attenuata]|uniref:Calcium-dependent protein kinase isoform 2 n=1 Tax=Nicotiana attenuata TaxID=49451 RepID=A0A1J6J586_NICAT|nr:calcium-dependent protein kinase isoform 2 [Nicotiana attenuata]
MANLPLPQYWNAPSENTNLNITHKVFAEKPNRETKTVIVTETMLTTPEETCNSVLEEDKEEFEPCLPQYLVEPSEYNSNNEARKVFDELSDWSKNAMQEPQKELTLTTKTHFPNDSMYHVAPIDAANNNANVVENEDKDNKEKVVTAIIEKAPLYIGSAFSISSNLIMIVGRYGLRLAQNLEAMSCMLPACTYDQLLNRGNWNGGTVSLTVENHGLGIQLLKWFDTGHAFMVDFGCTTLPNVPLSSKSDSHTSFNEIAKRSRGLVAMSYFETVSDMERTCPYPIFPCSYPQTMQQIATFVTVIASNIEGVDYVVGLEGLLLKVKNAEMKACALEVHSLLKIVGRKVSDYILPLARIAMYKTCWSSGCYNVDLLAAFNGALRDGIVLLYCGPDASQADYFNDAISIGSFQALRLGILVVASDGNQGSQSLYANLAIWTFIVAASYTNIDFTHAVEERLSLYDLIVMWILLNSLLHGLVENLATSKPTPVEFRRFCGKDPELWISQAERYFEFHGTSENNKLLRASLYLDGEALEWFRWLFQNKQLSDWEHFVEKVRIRFGKPHLEPPEGHVATIREDSTNSEAQVFDKMSHGCCGYKVFATERSSVKVVTKEPESDLKDATSEEVQVFDESSHRDEVSTSLVESTPVFEVLVSASIDLIKGSSATRAGEVFDNFSQGAGQTFQEFSPMADDFEIICPVLSKELESESEDCVNTHLIIHSYRLPFIIGNGEGSIVTYEDNKHSRTNAKCGNPKWNYYAEEEKSRTSVVLAFANIPQRVPNRFLLSPISHKESWVIHFLRHVSILPRDKKFILANEVLDIEMYVPDDILSVESTNLAWLEEFVLKQYLQQNFQCLFLSCIVLNRSTILPTSFCKNKCYMHLPMVLCVGGKLFDGTITRGCSLEKEHADSFRQLPNVVHNGHFMVVMHKELKLESSLLVSKDEYATQTTIFGLHIFIDGVNDFLLSPQPSITNNAKDLVPIMLPEDTKQRSTSAKFIEQPWLQWEEAADKPIDHIVLSKLKQFRVIGNLMKPAIKVIAADFSEEEIKYLKYVFATMATNNSGTITYERIKSGLARLASKLSEVKVLQLMQASFWKFEGSFD